MLNTKLLTTDKPLKARVESIEEGKASLVFSDKQKLKINAKFLPGEILEGEFVYLNLLSESGLAQERQDVAREVLREMLN